jgi:predicted site-specific integrase-resolvase
MNNKLLTAEQVSDILGVNTHTLAVWRCTGRYNLPYIKAGRLVRYSEQEIKSFIDRSTRDHTNSLSSVAGCN